MCDIYIYVCVCVCVCVCRHCKVKCVLYKYTSAAIQVIGNKFSATCHALLAVHFTILPVSQATQRNVERWRFTLHMVRVWNNPKYVSSFKRHLKTGLFNHNQKHSTTKPESSSDQEETDQSLETKYCIIQED